MPLVRHGEKLISRNYLTTPMKLTVKRHERMLWNFDSAALLVKKNTKSSMQRPRVRGTKVGVADGSSGSLIKPVYNPVSYMFF